MHQALACSPHVERLSFSWLQDIPRLCPLPSPSVILMSSKKAKVGHDPQAPISLELSTPPELNQQVDDHIIATHRPLVALKICATSGCVWVRVRIVCSQIGKKIFRRKEGNRLQSFGSVGPLVVSNPLTNISHWRHWGSSFQIWLKI